MKPNRIILIMVVLASLLAWLSYVKRKTPIDWTPGYSNDEKTPYGTYVLYDQLRELRITPIEKNLPLMEWLQEEMDLNGSALILMAENTELGEVDVSLLLEYAQRGNTVFLATEVMPEELLSALGTGVEDSWEMSPDTLTRHVLVNNRYSKDTFSFNRAYPSSYFELSPHFYGSILGMNANRQKPDFIAVPYGAGKFYLHLMPKAFSNMHLLQNPDYAGRCLSYLPPQEIFWDEYYKPEARMKGNTLQVISNNDALSYAWKLIIGGVLLAILFYSKRKQRAIPVMPQPENRSLEFIETIGDLYLHHGNHKDLADKKAFFFYQHIRERYHLNEQDTDFWQHLEMKSAAKPATLKKIKQTLLGLPGMSEVNPEFLARMNGLIEDFYQQTGKYHNHD